MPRWLHGANSLSPPTQYNAYPRIIAARYAAHAGDDDAAIEHLRTALEQGPGPSFLVYRRLLVQLVQQRNYPAVGTRFGRNIELARYPAVGELLDDAESRFGRNIELARWKATILEMQGRGAEAEKVRSKCVSDNILQLNERDRCRQPVELI